MLREKKRRLEARLTRKAAAIENVITVKEELAQYDNIFKLIIENRE